MDVVYLDWNILNKLWTLASQNKQDKDAFLTLERLIEQKTFLVPYSNAHIRDLVRGVVKRPEYAPIHTAAITRATNNLCIVQYWGEDSARWHIRDAAEFLQSTLDDSDYKAGSLTELFSDPDLDDTGLLAAAHALRLAAMDLQELPPTFKECYKADPVFSLMFPKAKVHNTMKALCEDIYDFTRNITTDHALYKQFRKFLSNAKARSMEVRKVSGEMSEQLAAIPAHLNWDEMWEQAAPKTQTSKNSRYDKIIDLYTRTDMKGYSPDERFGNMIDDALHTFYGAHCDYFVTMDNRCLLKAQKVYAELKIASKARSLAEFVAERV